MEIGWAGGNYGFCIENFKTRFSLVECGREGFFYKKLPSGHFERVFAKCEKGAGQPGRYACSALRGAGHSGRYACSAQRGAGQPGRYACSALRGAGHSGKVFAKWGIGAGHFGRGGSTLFEGAGHFGRCFWQILGFFREWTKPEGSLVGKAELEVNPCFVRQESGYEEVRRVGCVAV